MYLDVFAIAQISQPTVHLLFLFSPLPIPSSSQVLAGQGIDRHLLGLMLAAGEAGMERPAFFQDPAVQQNMRFHLFTGQVGTDFMGQSGKCTVEGYENRVLTHALPHHLLVSIHSCSPTVLSHSSSVHAYSLIHVLVHMYCLTHARPHLLYHSCSSTCIVSLMLVHAYCLLGVRNRGISRESSCSS